ncbi:hypothetical protein K7X08_033343 [Anisodus acutangulus]|uniref:Eukaryotic translation initiation factor 3 subunit J n=1 Tax=Anisodus acutangulus TaxID=402998 RepID=A0A9Q1M400_9SOLA|nr:hypothetical protein K7X08_033343 [Anisodus acutangulus]
MSSYPTLCPSFAMSLFLSNSKGLAIGDFCSVAFIAIRPSETHLHPTDILIYKLLWTEENQLEMEDWEDVPVPDLLKKDQPVSKWDDEDVDDNDVKESWEDEEEPTPAPKPEPPAEKAPKKSAAKASEKKGKEVEVHTKEEPLDPVAEKLRQQRLVEEADYKSTAELFAKKGGDDKTLDNFIPKSESDFLEYAELISHKLRPYEKSYYYSGLLKAVMRLSLTAMKGADAKEIGSSITAFANEKIKAEKEANASKKKTGGKKKQLHVDKEDDEAVIKIAEWNPEKNLLAMVTLIFNWKRLWTVSPEKNITSICWRPDGKAIAVGLEDGTISLHDVEVAQQASNIEDLSEVIRTSLSVMSKIWSDAMHTFHEKFNAVSTLIVDHGLDSTPQDEFLSLLGGARASPPLHQFLENSLGEAGLKRVAKAVNGAGKELQLIVLDHLQPAAEIIGFRIGELRGLSKWRAHYKGIGLDEKLMDNATERSGMLLVQVERFMKVLASVVQQFSNFFSWLRKSVKILMAEPSDQLPFNSELVIIFLKFLYDQDPVRQLLKLSEVDSSVEVDLETMERIKQLAYFGGFSDLEYLKRTLSQEFQQMEACFKDAFEMPFSTISEKLLCEDLLPLFPIASSSKLNPHKVPASMSYNEDILHEASESEIHQQTLTGYISFKLPDDSFPVTNCIGIVRRLTHDLGKVDNTYDPVKAALLCIPDGYHCTDLSLYKEGHIVLLINETAITSDSSGNAYMMILQAGDLPFVSLSRSNTPNSWKLHQLQHQEV